MNISKKILHAALSILNALTFWIKPEKNRITFVSLTQDHLEGDFRQIYSALKKTGRYDLRTNLIVYRKNPAGSAKYFFNCLKQLIEYKKSAMVILNDNNYVIANFKPAHLKVLQVWHACGAVKKFGNQIPRQYPVRGYDGVIASAEYWKAPYAQAFGIRPEQVYPVGMARNDDLLDRQKQKKKAEAFLEKHPELKGKRIVLYAPTFRGNIIDGLTADSFSIASVLDALDENTWILYKFHPLLEEQNIHHPRALDVSKENLYMLMELSSCLISDYSSVIFDYSLLNKPMISYIDDLEEYENTIGLNIPYLQDFPGPIARNESELIHALDNLEKNDRRLAAFAEKYNPHHDGKNTERIAALIDSIMKEEKHHLP